MLKRIAERIRICDSQKVSIKEQFQTTHLHTTMEQYNSEMNELKRAITGFSKYVDTMENEKLKKSSSMLMQ